VRFPHFFIDRPIFAAVLSILVVIVGAIAYPTLPVAQYPEIAPPTVVVNASFPGASAETLAETVAAPLEEQINGVWTNISSRPVRRAKEGRTEELNRSAKICRPHKTASQRKRRTTTVISTQRPPSGRSAVRRR
jgi:hypothetical protein